jgi:N-acetylglutamate synthase-like GNAT family acetyltransferase
MPGTHEPDVTEDVLGEPLPTLDRFAPVGVWLEPGRDGRMGGWLADLPIVVGAGTRDRVLSLALTAAGRYREWLELRGDDAGIPRIRRSEVVGEVPARHEPDGYEIGATLPPDRAPVTQERVAAAIRRLAWAREDMLAMADAIAAHEAEHGPLPVDTAVGERSAVEVLRHVARADAWLIGRLPAGGRYDGPLRTGDVRGMIEAAHAFAVERLRVLGLADDGVPVSDRHGETWTLAKVLRRMQAHGFDHLWELQRRLVRVDGTRDRIAIRLDRVPDAASMVGLLRSVGWDMRASEPASLQKAIDGTTEFATAWDGGRLIGTARSLSDGGQNALIATVVVHPAYQGLGVGERMVHLLTDEWDQVRFSLTSAPGLTGWYEKLGFLPDPNAMYRPRRRH